MKTKVGLISQIQIVKQIKKNKNTTNAKQEFNKILMQKKRKKKKEKKQGYENKMY